ncbi:hypothetical protein [Desulfosporosinus hippei]|uniref:Uncharacterized protein n=1 Tax=Desulfosporosinus hippei DSM 8344 TaxID=1121419 RepID=A0A1G8CFT6_9FIRM|nr:hypothetical protein [Desulfosporosinus hippei]SDH44252.1 hypothetical protein SAMN05443529_11388 [Desulfosporosinus hippei DSM 8344]
MDRRDLESIEEAIFKESLEHNLNIKDLGKLYAMLIRMRVQILDITEENLILQEVGEMWFRITESILNVRIMIKEKIGMDVSQDVEEMKKLCESRCNSEGPKTISALRSKET